MKQKMSVFMKCNECPVWSNLVQNKTLENDLRSLLEKPICELRHDINNILQRIISSAHLHAMKVEERMEELEKRTPSTAGDRVERALLVLGINRLR